VRNDAGVYEGFQVPIHYDPMLAKVIVHAATREDARRRMQRALVETRVEGPATNVPYLRWILDEPDVIENRVDTGWLERNHGGFAGSDAARPAREETAVIAAAIYAHREASKPQSGAPEANGTGDGLTPWVRTNRARRGRSPK
jgi:acetyl/propionyl-CoA carboxylase alpha subunit